MLTILTCVLIAVIGYFFSGVGQQFGQSLLGNLTNTEQVQATGEHLPDSAQIYYLDVGQGDSELIRMPTGETILIDAGTGETSEQLVRYLQNLQITKIDILIATHPHEDHIGGMKAIVENFEIGKIYMPEIAENQIPTTKVYEKLLEAIDEKGLKITQATPGTVIFDQDDAVMTILAPNSEKYSDLNSYSIVTKFTYGQKSFLFTGDAEADSEEEMIEKGYDLKCDILKCGHHGSSTSNSIEFLRAVSPDYAIISCGENNDYGHPHEEVVKALQEMGISIYRTDQQKTILVECDGDQILFFPDQQSVKEAS